MPFLYKYTGISDRTESLLTTPALWFSRPSKLNDPFECKPWYKIKYQPQQLFDAFARQIRRMNPSLTDHAVSAEATALLLAGRHRDPNAAEELRAGILSAIDSEIGILCLSRENTSILMWSHYCTDHKGICLGFEWSEYTPFFGRAQRVNYRKKLPQVDLFNSPKRAQVDKIFLTKFLAWRYEREWRIIDHDSGQGLHQYPGELLRTVTFGANTPPSDRARVRAWLGKRAHPVQLQECVLDRKSYMLHVQKLQ